MLEDPSLMQFWFCNARKLREQLIHSSLCPQQSPAWLSPLFCHEGSCVSSGISLHFSVSQFLICRSKQVLPSLSALSDRSGVDRLIRWELYSRAAATVISAQAPPAMQWAERNSVVLPIMFFINTQQPPTMFLRYGYIYPPFGSLTSL